MAGFTTTFAAGGQNMPITIDQNSVTEIVFHSTRTYPNPWLDVSLDLVITGPDDITMRVPAFWAGDNRWAARFSAERIGTYQYRTECSHLDDGGLHDKTGAIEVVPYKGRNPLRKHGRLRVADDKRHFEQADGTPFFWMGDTWWMGFTERLDWHESFRTLTADRVAKGFNVIQIVAGPLPDMDAWDPRGKNEGGFPFTEGFASVNPLFFDFADVKVAHLVDSGLMPCIVGMWGYYLPQIGVEKVKHFWRYLVARYGAYPVVWCLAGEGTMPYYLSKTPKEDAALQKRGWTEVAAYVRSIDPYNNLITIHPSRRGREVLEDSSLMDFEMLQTGHSDIHDIPGSVKTVCEAVQDKPRMPVIVGEVNYEGILSRCGPHVQRLSFYTAVFNGTAGHTYGANGIWQVNRKDQPYGTSPHGRSWGDTPWDVAAALPGGKQVAIGAALFARYPWWRLEKHPEWVEAETNETDPYAVRCVGIPRRLRLIYLPWKWNMPALVGFEPDVPYTAAFFDPLTAERREVGPVQPNSDGKWQIPLPGEVRDWILILEVAS